MSAAPSRLGLGLVLGLGLTMFGCVEEDDPEDTAASMSIGNDSQDSQEADAVTYAGPDTWESTIGNDTVGNDSQEADAVTYAGPDETTWIGDSTTTGDGTTTSDGTTTTAATESDSQEADAVTYAGPDETDSVTSSTG